MLVNKNRGKIGNQVRDKQVNLKHHTHKESREEVSKVLKDKTVCATEKDSMTTHFSR